MKSRPSKPKKVSRKRNTQTDDLPPLPQKVKSNNPLQDIKTPLRTFQNQQQHRARDHARDELKE